MALQDSLDLLAEFMGVGQEVAAVTNAVGTGGGGEQPGKQAMGEAGEAGPSWVPGHRSLHLPLLPGVTLLPCSQPWEAWAGPGAVAAF